MAGLLLFVTLYFALAGWFLYTAWRVIVGGAGSDLGWVAWLMALVSLFLGGFMVKAIFSVKNDKPSGLHEITASQQPRLFAFLYELADAAGAPRPHKVFLSSRVNAAVFYDLSLFNLFFPSKKNLEIGLALVNTLSLGEFRAVLAHEFGHFAQRSMAVGRWVYVAQQIASHLVTRRDILDDILVNIGNLDLRIRAVVAVVQLIIWSIRSLVEQLFQLVVLMQRALSREMEMQADLVAVSLTGSDALIHALHKLQGADDAWDRALHFVFGEQGDGRATRDVFAVQSHMIARMSAILNDDAYAKVPAMPDSGQDQHRIFKADLAQPPKMWLTHPLNHEREANAKRVYVPAAIDPASAWTVFERVNEVREDITRDLLGESKAKEVELEESLKTLGRQFKREHYNRRYCGVFFGRMLARHVNTHQQLRDPQYQADIAELASMYPDSLTADVHTLRSLETQLGQIDALIAGTMTAPGKVVRVRGVEFRKKELPAARTAVCDDIAHIAARLHAHDKLCRSWHQAHALRMGGQWQPYLDGLLALIHYAEHTAADLQDLHGVLNNTTAVVTAIRRVGSDGVARVVADANRLHQALYKVHQEAPGVQPDALLRARLELSGTWSEALGELTLPPACNDNINDWMGVIGGWVGSCVNLLNATRSAALEELLLAETAVARHARLGGEVAIAPAPSLAPVAYALLAPGAERKRQTKLDLWARFQRAEGLLPGGARLLAAGGIVAVVLGASSFNEGHGTSMFGADPTLKVFNGLGLPVVASIDGHTVTVPPGQARPLVLPAFGKHHVEARTKDGKLIESFDAEAKKGGHPVYSVAGAVPLVEWSAAYGKLEPKPDRMVGAVRWLDSGADDILVEPPKSVTSKYGSYRTVLSAAATAAPEYQVQMIDDDKQRHRVAHLHVRWDSTSAPHTQSWMNIAAAYPGYAALIAQRLKNAPADVVLRREQFDAADPAQQKVLCSEADAQSKAAPDDGNLKYLALRCQSDSFALAAQARQAALRWPDNAWLAYTVAYDQLATSDYKAALAGFEKAATQLPGRASQLAGDIGRIRHYLDPEADLSAQTAQSPVLNYMVNQHHGVGDPGTPGRAFAALAAGQLDSALAYSKGDQGSAATVLRLVAASDGASDEVVARAMALRPEQGAAMPTVWLMVGMDLRSGADPAKHRAAAIAASGNFGTQMAAFMDSVRKGDDPRVSERLLASTNPQVRGFAYSAAIVAKGRKAPQAWRDYVKRMLFAPERPYFT